MKTFRDCCRQVSIAVSIVSLLGRTRPAVEVTLWEGRLQSLSTETVSQRDEPTGERSREESSGLKHSEGVPGSSDMVPLPCFPTGPVGNPACGPKRPQFEESLVWVPGRSRIEHLGT